MPSLHEAPDRVPQLDPAAGIESCRRLVEQEQPRRTDQAGAQVEPPAHPARVGPGQAIGGFAQPELVEHGVRAVLRRLAIPSEQSGDHLEVLAAAHGRLDRRELPGQPDDPAHRTRIATHVVAGHPQRAFVE